MRAADRGEGMAGADEFAQRALGVRDAQDHPPDLGRAFPDAEFELEKPVFDIETPDGSCLPDFLIRARRGGEELAFVIEIMGFERTEYLRGKEVTHPRMATLGPLHTIRASEFDGSPEGVTGEGRKVTAAIRAVLERRWKE